MRIVRLRRLGRGGLLLAIMLSFLGCESIVPREQPVTTYELAPRLPDVKHTARPLSIYVASPRSSAVYGSSRIAYVKRPYEVNYYALNEWAAEPARLLEPLLVASLEASNLFESVTSGATSPPTELRLDTQIVTLRQEFDANSSKTRVVIRAEVVDTVSRRVVLSRRLEAFEPATTPDAYGGVGAANRALERLLAEIVALCARASPGAL